MRGVHSVQMTGGVARFLTLNLWGENGPWEARIAVINRGLDALAPDVIGLQEVREVPGRVPNQAALLAAARGWHHAFAPTSSWGGGQEGLAIVSRFPIGAQEFRPLPHSTETEGRGILSARLDGEAGGSGSTARTFRTASTKVSGARRRCSSSTRC